MTAYEMRISDWSSDVCSSDLFGAEQRQLAFAGQVALEAVELFAEVGHVLERAVHGGETHVGHVVELAQLGHHELAYPARGQLAFGGHAQLVDHRANRGLGLLFRYRALVQRAVEPLAQLARVEGVAAPVGLEDRTSVVSGKRVSVSVDPGGRRISKTKQKTK